MRFLLYIVLLTITGCTSVASSTAALVVALHSDKMEKDTRRYKGIDKCFIEGMPSPLDVGYEIFNNPSRAGKYQAILNPELKEVEEFSAKDLSYAFFYIAQRMQDRRAWQYLELVRPHLSNEKQYKEIEKFVDFKYLQSHLTKCFNVPYEHRVRLKDRDLLDKVKN